MIQSGYELPPLLPELRSLQAREPDAQALSGLLPAKEEPHDASSVATSIQISEDRDVRLVDKHQEGTTCNSLMVGANDSDRGTPLLQGSTCNVPPPGSRMQDIIAKPISGGATCTFDVGTTHIEPSPPDTPESSKTGATDPDSVVKTECDEVISQVQCRLDTI